MRLSYFRTKNPSISDADDYEKLTSLKFMRTSTIYYIQILVSLITIFILALGNASNAYIVWAIIPFIITIIPSIIFSNKKSKHQRWNNGNYKWNNCPKNVCVRSIT